MIKFEDGSPCPACEIGILREQEIPLDFLYVTIKGQKSYVCTICRESFLNKDISKKIDSILTETRKQLWR